MKFSGKTYDVLKFITQVGLPAAGTLYFALAGIWGLPSAEQVVGTIVAVDTFLGVMLQIASTAYNNSEAKYDGDLVITNTEMGRQFSLELAGDPDVNKLADRNEIIFKVKKPDA